MNFLCILFSVIATFSTLLLADAPVQPNSLNTEPKSWLEQVKEEHLASIHFEHGSWDEDDYGKYLARILEMRYHPEPHLLRSQALSFYIASQRKNNQLEGIINEMTTCKNLDLICGSHQKEAHLLHQIARTKTELGLVTLMGMIVQPTTNVVTLKRRQEIIRFFVDRPAILTAVTEALEQIKKNEAIMLGFWGDWDPFKNVAKRNLFISALDELNRSTTALELKSFYDHQQRVWWTGMQVVAAGALLLHGVFTLFDVDDQPQKLKDYASQCGSGSNVISAFLWNKENKWLHASLSIAAGVITSLYIEENVKWTTASFFLEECLQRILMSVSDYFYQVQTISRLCHRYPELLQVMPELKRVSMLFDHRTGVSADCLELLELLSSDTFKGEPSIFSQKGKILRAYNLMSTIKDQFIGVIHSVGQLDVYAGLAELYREHQTKKNGYCFVEYVDSVTPHVEAEVMWNPFLDADVAIGNHAHLSAATGINLVATGPNAGGKSTYLKGITLAIILAQSIGMAPAKSMSCACFHRIASYMNVTDNIAQGQSLFKAEVERAQELVGMMELLALQNKRGFIICDEMLSGTSPVEGEAAAYSLAKHLGQLPTISCVIATHFPLLTRLASEVPSFSNVKVSVIKHEDGTIEYPFLVEPGVAHQHVAFDIMRLAGMKGSIVEEASRLVAGISF